MKIKHVKRKMNGLTDELNIVVKEVPNMASTIVGVVVGVGSRYEEKHEFGMSHFLEHMMFKGTTTRTHDQITKELEGIGGMLNAWTSTEQTFFHTRFVGNHTGKVINILNDMLFLSKIAPFDVASEKDVVCQEIKMYEDDASAQADDLMDKMMYKDTELGHSIAGDVKTVQGYNMSDLYSFYLKHYKINNMTLVVVGNTNLKKVIKELDKNWKSSEQLDNAIYTCKKITKLKNTERIVTEYRKTEQTNVMLGVPAFGKSHKDHGTLQLLSVILGGNMSSRLWETVREQHGLAYNIRASIDSTQDTGMFKVSAGVDPSNTVKCITDIIETIREAKKDISEDELKRAKNYLISSIKMVDESITGKTNIVVRELLAKENKSLKQAISNYKKVTIKDINRVFNKVMKEENFAVSMVGPVSPLTVQRIKDEFGF